jgi:hypothetical protein
MINRRGQMLGGVVGFLGHHGLAVRIGMFHHCWFCSIAASPDIPVTAALASVTKIYAPVERASTWFCHGSIALTMIWASVSRSIRFNTGCMAMKSAGVHTCLPKFAFR